MDPAKLKVVDLRQELQQRGLDTKGVKAALVKRLKDALEKESAKETKSEPVVEEQKKETEKECKPSIEKPPSENKSPPKIQSISEKKVDEKEVPEKNEEIKADVKLGTEDTEENKDTSEEQIEMEQDQEEKVAPENDQEKPEENGDHIDEPSPSDEAMNEKSPEKKEKPKSKEPIKKSSDSAKSGTPSGGKRKRHDSDEEERTVKKLREKHYEVTVIKEDEPDIDYDKVQISWYDSDLNLQVDKQTLVSAKPLTEGCFGFIWAGARATYGISTGKVCFEVKITEELKWEDPTKHIQEHRDRDRSKYKLDLRDRSRKSTEKKSSEKTKEETDSKEESVEKEGTEATDKPTEANEGEKMETDDIKEEPKANAEEPTEKKESTEQSESKENADSTEVKDGDNKEETSESNPSEQPTKEKEAVSETVKQPIPLYYFRVGFSKPGTTLQLGEAEYSYAFESTGKFIANKQFEDYGSSFGVGDVVGAYLDIGEEKVTISYTVNGVSQSAATTIPRSELPQEDFALFPHVLCRNYAYELNFGNREEPWFPHPAELNDYVFLQSVPKKVSGPRRPDNRNECELILMIGLTGSGKTHWVKQHIASTTDKTYTVIGNDSIFERMTVNGEPFKSHFSGSWRFLIDKLQKCLNTITDIASLRRRNIIIDQSNVFSPAQNRKLRAFEGFKRKAVCLICGDEELARRQKESNTDIPESTMLRQKSRIELPYKFENLDLIFPDLNEEESKKMIKKYHEEGQDDSYYKRPYDNRRDNRRSYYQHNNYRDRGYGGRYERHSQGGWGGGRPSGNWNRDRRDSRGPSTPRHGGGSSYRPQDRGPRSEDRSRFRESRSSSGHYGSGRSQNSRHSGNWSSGGSGSGSWGSSNHQGYNQQLYGSHGYGAWSQNQSWKYQGQGGYSGSGGQGSGGYGQGQGYNYYGQYNQGWGNHSRK